MKARRWPGRLRRAAVITAALAGLSCLLVLNLASSCGDGDPFGARLDPWKHSGALDPWTHAGTGWRPGHYGPAWGLLDGRTVVVFRWEEGQGDRGGSIYAVGADGTGLTLLSPSVGDGRELGDQWEERIAYDASPAVSPDGTRVAYGTLRHSLFGTRYDIVTVELGAGGERRRLTSDPEDLEERRFHESETEPAWSPDGTRIAFLKDREVHTMAADGSDVRSIAPGIESVWEPPAWSPDGTRLAFREATGRRRAVGPVYVARADGSELTRLTEEKAGPLAWSPDGRHIALVGELGEVESIGLALVVVDVDGGGRRVVAEGHLSGPPLWSPDGAEIFVDYYEPSDSNPPPLSWYPGLRAITVGDEPVIRQVTGVDGVVTGILGMAWSPDGARLAVILAPFAGGGVFLYTVAADGSELRVLVREGPEGELVVEGEPAP